MYPSREEQIVINVAERLMEETMARYDPSHDAFHVQRVRKTALSLAHSLSDKGQASPDPLTIELAALLHDVLDKKYVSAADAADPYAYFLPFFERAAKDGAPNLVEDGRAKTIARIVDNVSWTTEKRLRAAGKWGAWHDSCTELHCVQDADRLDAIGAFGVLRCAAYSAATNHALYAPEGNPAQPASAIQHFHDKLVHISGRLKTEPGRALGEKRHQLMLNFLAAVDDELSAEV